MLELFASTKVFGKENSELRLFMLLLPSASSALYNGELPSVFLCVKLSWSCFFRALVQSKYKMSLLP